MSDINSTLELIDDATEGRCACGCGKHLDPDGPSQWYATPECQQRYLERQTADPQSVYSRPDAAYTLVGADHLEVPINDDRPGLIPTQLRINGADFTRDVRRIQLGWHAGDASSTPEQWIAANPSMGASVDVGRIRERIAELIGDDLTDWQADIVERTFVARPDLAERAQAEGLDVIASDTVPEGQVMVINHQAYQDMLLPYLNAPISFTSEPMDFDRNIQRFRFEMEAVARHHEGVIRRFGEAFQSFAEPVTEALQVVVDEAARYFHLIDEARRLRHHHLHSSYRQRVRARRRRNR